MKTGLTSLLRAMPASLRGVPFGLIANPTTVDERLRHTVDLLHGHPDANLVRLFGPEHGLRAEAQDMAHVGHGRDPSTGLEIVSLYGHTEESLSPTQESLQDLEALVFDVQDIGARYYTYAATMALCMRVAKAAGIHMVVLDRPNPLGGLAVEGGGLTADLASFVGLYPIPQRHGLTVGELARLYNHSFGIDCDLEVVACQGWDRAQFFDETGLPWVMPSPNMPTLDTAVVYPGMCLLEGTNLSEGRGTTRPFELFGAPYVDAVAMCAALTRLGLPGVVFRPCSFFPMFQKWAGQLCHGAQLHVTDRERFLPYRSGLAVVCVARELFGDAFAWRTDVYEFRDNVPAIDLLTGAARVREAIDAGADLDAVVAACAGDLSVYDAGRPEALLY